MLEPTQVVGRYYGDGKGSLFSSVVAKGKIRLLVFALFTFSLPITEYPLDYLSTYLPWVGQGVKDNEKE